MCRTTREVIIEIQTHFAVIRSFAVVLHCWFWCVKIIFGSNVCKRDVRLTVCDGRLFSNVVTDTTHYLTHKTEEKYPRQVNVKNYNMLRV